jgi:hypothetical protein
MFSPARTDPIFEIDLVDLDPDTADFLGTIREVVCNPLFEIEQSLSSVLIRSVAYVPSVVPKLDRKMGQVMFVAERTKTCCV